MSRYGCPGVARRGIRAIERLCFDWMTLLGAIKPRVPAPSLTPECGRLIEPTCTADPRRHRPLRFRAPRMCVHLDRGDQDCRGLYTSRRRESEGGSRGDVPLHLFPQLSRPCSKVRVGMISVRDIGTHFHPSPSRPLRRKRGRWSGDTSLLEPCPTLRGPEPD